MPELRLLTEQELQAWMDAQRWIYAKTMPKHPHEYSLKRLQDPRLFECVVLTIWQRGYDRLYLRRPWRSLDIGDHYVWVHSRPKEGMAAPLHVSKLINRARRVQEPLL